MRAKLTLLIAAALVLALGAIASACDRESGDSGATGEELPLPEYFQQVEELDAEKDARLAELEEIAEAGLASAQSTEDAIGVLQEQFPGSLEATKTFVDGMADLTPPAAARDAHDNAVEKGRKAIEALEEAAVMIAEAETEGDLEAALSDAFVTAGDEFEQTCDDLLAVAEEYGVDTDLDCD